MASLVPQFVGPEKPNSPKLFKFVDNPKFGYTSGIIKTYGPKGYIIEGVTPQERARNFKSKSLMVLTFQ